MQLELVMRLASLSQMGSVMGNLTSHFGWTMVSSGSVRHQSRCCESGCVMGYLQSLDFG